MTSSTVSELWKTTLPGDDKSCRMRQCRESHEPARRRCGRRTRRSAPFETPARRVACRCDGQPGYLACNTRELVLEVRTPGPSSDLAKGGTGRRPHARPTAALRPAKPVALTQYRNSSPIAVKAAVKAAARQWAPLASPRSGLVSTYNRAIYFSYA